MWSVIQTDMELLHWMCDLWYVIYVIAPLNVTVWHCDTDQCVICDRWVDKRGSSILCSPMCDVWSVWSAPQCVMPVCAPMCTNVHQCAPMCTNVHQCAPICTNVHQCAPMCSPMCDASQLVVRTNRPNIDPPFVRCAQYRKYRPAISPRFDGKEYFCPQKSANLCQSITVRHMISHLYQLIFSQSYLKISSRTAKQKESLFYN